MKHFRHLVLGQLAHDRAVDRIAGPRTSLEQQIVGLPGDADDVHLPVPADYFRFQRLLSCFALLPHQRLRQLFKGRAPNEGT